MTPSSITRTRQTTGALVLVHQVSKHESLSLPQSSRLLFSNKQGVNKGPQGVRRKKQTRTELPRARVVLVT